MQKKMALLPNKPMRNTFPYNEKEKCNGMGKGIKYKFLFTIADLVQGV